jgi:colicin import membrane protein
MPKAERAIHDAKIQTSVNQYAAYKARAAKQLAKAEKERAARAERAAKAEAQAKKKAEAQATKAAQAEGRK